MTPNSLDDEQVASELESSVVRVECALDRPSWIMRAIQFVLATMLIGIVVHGLLRPSADGSAQSARQSVDAQPATERDTWGAEAMLRTHPLPSVSRPPVVQVSAAPDDDSLGSLYDIRDYLDMRRVARETRAYELGLTSRDALVHLTLTREPNR